MRDEIETKRRLLTRALYLEIVSPTAANKRKADRIPACSVRGSSKKETPRSARGLDSLLHKVQEFLPRLASRHRLGSSADRADFQPQSECDAVSVVQQHDGVVNLPSRACQTTSIGSPTRTTASLTLRSSARAKVRYGRVCESRESRRRSCVGADLILTPKPENSKPPSP
jgi:hypothetical protein